MFIKLCEYCQEKGFNLAYCQMKDRKFFDVEKTPKGIVTFHGQSLSFEELVESTYEQLKMMFGERPEEDEEDDDDDDL